MDLTWMRRSWGPGVGVGRCLSSRTPAALEGRIAARCWDEVGEDMMNGCVLLGGNKGWSWKDENEMQKTG